MSDRQPAERSASSTGATSGEVDNKPPPTWADPGTWSASTKFFPVYIGLVATFIAIYWNNLSGGSGLDVSNYASCVSEFNYTFPINAASSQAHEGSQSAKDVAWAYEATQQIYKPERSVFGSNPFPKGKVPSLGARLDEASIYFDDKMLETRRTLLQEENLVDSSSTALGVAALQFGQKWSAKSTLKSTEVLKEALFKAPLHRGAISHRFDRPELRAEAPGLFAPFLAYYGVANDNLVLVKEAARQVQVYRDNLAISTGKTKGLWKSADTDPKPWSTGNAIAAYGMAKLRATIAAWPKSNATMSKELDDLDFWIQEILDAAIETDNDKSELLRNHLGDSSSAGETSGTSLLAATAYRMAKIRPEVFGKARYLDWAARKRLAVFSKFDSSSVGPEGDSFLILLGTAWRDVVCSGGDNQAVLDGYFAETQTEPAGPPLSVQSVTGYTVSEILEAYRQHLRRFYGMLWRTIKATFERTTGYSVDSLYAQAMEPLKRYGKYLSGPS